MKKFFSLIGLVVVAVCVYVAFQPPHYSIQRSIVIKATPEALFPFINNSRLANEWMPWAESDPALKMSFSGPEEGVGATSSWESTGHMGKGKAEVVESVPNVSVNTQLTYTEPMPMSQLAQMTLEPLPDGTRLTWSVTGENSFVGRLFCLVMNMDKMVGGEFEKGLGNLKRRVERTTAN